MTREQVKPVLSKRRRPAWQPQRLLLTGVQERHAVKGSLGGTVELDGLPRLGHLSHPDISKEQLQ